jgi:hypothetical protein
LLGAVSVVVAAVVAFAVVGDDDSAPAATGDVAFELVRMDGAFESAGTLRAATTVEAYHSLWDMAGLEAERPEVDLDANVVVSITIPDDACPPELAGFDREGDTITPVFVEPTGVDCPEPYLPKTFIVALARVSLGPSFRLFLPGQEIYGFGDSSTVVHLDGPPPPPACRKVESFAEQLDETGITVDYEPSTSPAELLDEDALALRGVLTGGFASTTIEDVDGLEDTWVAYEVEVEEWLFLGRPMADLPQRQYVALDVSEAISIDEHAEVARAAAGTPVVAVAYLMPVPPGYVVAGEEGLVTACDAGPLLGRVGFQGEWAEIDTLDDLADAL